jgi:hypothetical protein
MPHKENKDCRYSEGSDYTPSAFPGRLLVRTVAADMLK